jgi:thiol-disulfide isomerase/thioredoxin
LAGLTGRPTLVNLWGSWCEPCQKEERYLSSAYNALKNRVRFLGVDTVDSADSALDFDAHVTPPVRYPSVFDPDKKVITALGYSGPPETIFVDAGGRIVGRRTEPYTSTSEVKADVARYLDVAS